MVAPLASGGMGAVYLARHVTTGERVALVTRRGKVLRIDPAAVNPQGAAGNGVAGVKLAADGDEVIAALPLLVLMSCEEAPDTRGKAVRMAAGCLLGLVSLNTYLVYA